MFKFAALGDTRSGISTLQTISRSVVSVANPNFILFSGDLTESNPTLTMFNAWKNALNGGGQNTNFNKTFAIRGNHDIVSPTYNWQTEFDFNSVATAVGATSYRELVTDMTYSFDYENCHFIGIDIHDNMNEFTTSVLNWLNTDIADAEGRGMQHHFMFYHLPFYPVDSHCCPVPPSGLINIINNHPKVFGGFHGHEHLVTYTHVTGASPGGPSTLTVPYENFISGASGAGLYSLQSGRQVNYWLDSAAGSISSGFIIVTVNGDYITTDFYIPNGTLKNTILFGTPPVCPQVIVSISIGG